MQELGEVGVAVGPVSRPGAAVSVAVGGDLVAQAPRLSPLSPTVPVAAAGAVAAHLATLTGCLESAQSLSK